MKRAIYNISKRIKQNKLFSSLVISAIAGTMLILVRVFFSGRYTYLFLIWNLMLAYIPFFISSYLKKKERLNKLGLETVLLLVIWIIFFPNAPYILTDFFHLYQRVHIPLWYDLVIITTFAWNGLIIGFIYLEMKIK